MFIRGSRWEVTARRVRAEPREHTSPLGGGELWGEACPFGPCVACRVACVAPLVAPASGGGSDPRHAVTVERSTRRFCGGVGLREQSTPASVCLDPVTAAAAGESSRLCRQAWEKNGKPPSAWRQTRRAFGLSTVPAELGNWLSPRLPPRSRGPSPWRISAGGQDRPRGEGRG